MHIRLQSYIASGYWKCTYFWSTIELSKDLF